MSFGREAFLKKTWMQCTIINFRFYLSQETSRSMFLNGECFAVGVIYVVWEWKEKYGGTICGMILCKYDDIQKFLDEIRFKI